MSESASGVRKIVGQSFILCFENWLDCWNLDPFRFSLLLKPWCNVVLSESIGLLTSMSPFPPMNCLTYYLLHNQILQGIIIKKDTTWIQICKSYWIPLVGPPHTSTSNMHVSKDPLSSFMFKSRRHGRNYPTVQLLTPLEWNEKLTHTEATNTWRIKIVQWSR